MEIDRIKLSKEVNVFGDHYWVGMEGILLPNEDALAGLHELKKQIEKFSEIDYEHTGTKVKIIEPVIPASESIEVPSMADQINSCTDINVLVTYEFILKNHKDYKTDVVLRKLYAKKLKELSKNK